MFFPGLATSFFCHLGFAVGSFCYLGRVAGTFYHMSLATGFYHLGLAIGPFYYLGLTTGSSCYLGLFYWALLPAVPYLSPLTTSLFFCHMGSATGRYLLLAPYYQLAAPFIAWNLLSAFPCYQLLATCPFSVMS